MSPIVIGAIVFAGSSIGWALGLKRRMKDDPTLQGKGLSALFKKR